MVSFPNPLQKQVKRETWLGQNWEDTFGIWSELSKQNNSQFHQPPCCSLPLLRNLSSKIVAWWSAWVFHKQESYLNKNLCLKYETRLEMAKPLLPPKFKPTMHYGEVVSICVLKQCKIVNIGNYFLTINWRVQKNIIIWKREGGVYTDKTGVKFD